MKRQEYAEAKRRLDQVRRELETELLTPEQQRELELSAATLERSLHRGARTSRAIGALIGAVFAAALAVAYNAFAAAPQAGPIPQATAAWDSVHFYVRLCVPWALFGALVGAMLGASRKESR